MNLELGKVRKPQTSKAVFLSCKGEKKKKISILSISLKTISSPNNDQKVQHADQAAKQRPNHWTKLPNHPWTTKPFRHKHVGASQSH